MYTHNPYIGLHTPLEGPARKESGTPGPDLLEIPGRDPPQDTQEYLGRMILLMEEILHHLKSYELQ